MNAPVHARNLINKLQTGSEMLTERENCKKKTLMENGHVENMWGMTEHVWSDKLIKAMTCKNKIVTRVSILKEL